MSKAAAATTVKIPLKLYGLHARYATALYSAASKAKSLKEVEGDIASVSKLITTVPKFEQYLKNPIVKRTEKKADLDKMSKGMNAITRGFLGVLAEEGRLGELPKILSTFNMLMDADRGIVNATVTSAKELKAEDLKTVEAQLKESFLQQGQTTRLTKKVEADILGGLQIQVGDKFLDLSLASEIAKIKKALKASA